MPDPGAVPPPWLLQVLLLVDQLEVCSGAFAFVSNEPLAVPAS